MAASMFSWGGRPDDKANAIVDKLFYTRFLDKATCKGCNQEVMGIYGPEDHGKFYCRKCWCKYLKAAKEEEWQEWLEWDPQRKCPTDSPRHHEIKCVLLALSRVGGSYTFPCSLSSFDRMKVHTFCKEEPELTDLRTKSYGEGPQRFLRVSSMDAEVGKAEARALLEVDAAPAGGDAGGIADKLEQLTLDEQGPAAAGAAQSAGQPAPGTQGVAPAPSTAPQLEELKPKPQDSASAQDGAGQECPFQPGLDRGGELPKETAQPVLPQQRNGKTEDMNPSAPGKKERAEAPGNTEHAEVPRAEGAVVGRAKPDNGKSQTLAMSPATGAQKNAKNGDAKPSAPGKKHSEEMSVGPMQTDESGFPSLSAAAGPKRKGGKKK